MRKIFCIGGAGIDYKLKTLANLQLGTSNPAQTTKSYGGVARNVASNLAQLTQDVHLQCTVGDDEDGINILKKASEQSIDISSSLILKNQATAKYYAILNENNELHIALADMNIYQHISLTELSSSWDKFRKDCIIFLETNLSSETLAYAQHYFSNNYVCIDAVSASKACKLAYDLTGIDLLKIDRHEAEALTNITCNSSANYQQICEKLLCRGVKNILLTLGVEGHIVASEYAFKKFPAFKIADIIDVSGAGDAFIAGVLTGLQRNYELSLCSLYGAAAAYFTLQSLNTVCDELSFSKLQHFVNKKEYDYASVF